MGKSSWVSKNGARWLIAICISQPSTVMMRSCSVSPALFQSTSRVGVCAFTCFAKPRTSSSEDKSPVTRSNSPSGVMRCSSSTTGLPRSTVRACSRTFHPCLASRCAPALPMPVEAPVIKITGFEGGITISLRCFFRGYGRLEMGVSFVLDLSVC